MFLDSSIYPNTLQNFSWIFISLIWENLPNFSLLPWLLMKITVFILSWFYLASNSFILWSWNSLKFRNLKLNRSVSFNTLLLQILSNFPSCSWYMFFLNADWNSVVILSNYFWRHSNFLKYLYKPKNTNSSKRNNIFEFRVEKIKSYSSSLR